MAKKLEENNDAVRSVVTRDKYQEYTKDDLVRLLRERDRKPKFGLVWERDEIDHDLSVNSDFVAMDFIPELSCGEGPYRNLLIEADNFDALRYLRMTHAGKVKCIYIDPPYNTGNKDFIYNDSFVDKDDVYKHSKWLEYMYRRLTIARDLLREDGVIFVSIGEEEFANLSLLMEQVFPGMKICTFVWRRRTGAHDTKGAFVSEDHEYIICFGGPKFAFAGQAKDTSNYTNPDNDPRGPWIRDNLTCNKSSTERPNLYYSITNPKNNITYNANPNRVWAYQKSRMDRLIEEGKILFPNGEVGTPMYKRHLCEVRRTEKPLSTWIFSSSDNIPQEDEVQVMKSGLNQEGTKILLQMLGEKAFSYPKPLSLLTSLITQATENDDLILDFFAGSGTTGHAVLAVNSSEELEGTRKFILVSSTEATAKEVDKNICKDVTRERLRLAVEGYSYKNKSSSVNIPALGGNFAYLRAKRLSTEIVFTKIQHEQIWIAFLMMRSHGILRKILTMT